MMLDAVFLGNPLRQWAIAVVVTVGSLVVVWLLLTAVRRRVAARAGGAGTQWDDIVIQALGRTKALFPVVLSAVMGTAALELPARIRTGIEAAAVLALLLQGSLWLSTGFTVWLRRYTEQLLRADRGAATTVSALGFVVKLVLWSVVALLALDNLGVNITTVVAGLGVGGVAVALAAQTILGDLFASLSIVLDKPFVLGDFVVVDEHLGTVEHIGLKTTRLRSLGGEEVVFANGDLLKSRLRNYGRMAERRVQFRIGVTYETARDRLVKVPQIIRTVIEQQALTRFDRSHFRDYGDFALIFESVYYVLSPDYNSYMEIQQAINLGIHERFEREGIVFAYPTQTLRLVQATA